MNKPVTHSGEETHGDEGRQLELIAEEIEKHRKWLQAAAHNIAPENYEAEDLLSDAITRLMLATRNPKFRIENVRSYITATMRNLAVDYSRSPRSTIDSKDSAFFTQLEQEVVDETNEYRAVELQPEYELVKRAFVQLKEVEQRLLTEVVLNGKQISQVAAELGMSAQNGSVRLFRAKAALKRVLLVQHLRQGSDVCSQNADKIRGEVHEDLAKHSPRSRGIRHVHTCESCRTNWRAFALMSQALGVTGLISVAAGHKLSLPPEQHPSAPSTTIAKDSPAEAGARTTIAATATGVSRSGAILVRALSSKTSLLAGMGCIACALLAGGAHLFVNNGTESTTVERVQLQPGEELDAWFDVSSQQVGETALLTVEFGVADVEWWRVEHLSLVLPEGAQLLATPEGLECDSGPIEVTCFAPVKNWDRGTFEVKREAGAVQADTEGSHSNQEQFTLQVDASTVNSVQLVGEAITTL